MNLKKHTIFLGILLLLTFLITACSSSQNSTDNNEPASTDEIIRKSDKEEIPITTEEADVTEKAETSNKSLVAYFSYTGNTEEAAEEIVSYTGGDLKEIERVTAYPEDNEAFMEEAEAEINNNARPVIKVDLESIDEYDVIFVGYPIWWDKAPAMIATFLESYDFAGKTIVPFCTSSSDGIEKSIDIFTEICPDAVIAEGLAVKNQDDIKTWLDKLGF